MIVRTFLRIRPYFFQKEFGACSAKCITPCERTEYETEVTSSSYPSSVLRTQYTEEQAELKERRSPKQEIRLEGLNYQFSSGRSTYGSSGFFQKTSATTSSMRGANRRRPNKCRLRKNCGSGTSPWASVDLVYGTHAQET